MSHPNNAPANAPAGAAQTLTVYSRAGCHLCDEMLYALKARQPIYGFQIETVDVDTSETLKAKHGLRVPVLMAGDEEICWGQLDDEALQAWLSAT